MPPHHRVTAPPHHHVTALASHLPCHLPPNQSVICLGPCHQTSQSFALPPASKSVIHLTCPLPPWHCGTVSLHHLGTAALHHHITTLVSHLSCPLPPNQSAICLAPCHQTSQLFDLPSTTVALQHRITMAPHHCISESFALPPATKPVSHLTCPLPPNQSVI